MRCATAKVELLRLNDGVLSEELRDHLNGCAACRRWFHGLQKVDRVLPVLPIPRPLPGAKEQLLARLGADPSITTLEDLAPPPLTRPFPTRAFAFGAVLAASVMIGLLLFQMARPRSQPPVVETPEPADPLLAKVVDCNVRLAVLENPVEQVETLIGLAGELQRETKQIARIAEAKDVQALASLYAQVIDQGIRPRLADIAKTDRRRLVSLEEEFAAAGRSAEELAKEVPPTAVEPLRVIARAAERGRSAIQEKLREVES